MFGSTLVFAVIFGVSFTRSGSSNELRNFSSNASSFLVLSVTIA